MSVRAWNAALCRFRRFLAHFPCYTRVPLRLNLPGRSRIAVMPHSDPDKHREASREAMRRYRERQRTGQQPQQPKERAPREGAEIRKIDRLTRVHESRVPKWAKPVLDAGIDLTTEAGRLDAVRRCRAARAEHKAALKVKLPRPKPMPSGRPSARSSAAPSAGSRSRRFVCLVT